MVSVTNILIAGILGTLTGVLGAMLGLGGGVFLVPLLVLVLDLPIRTAIGISLTTVIATSSAVSSRTAGQGLINLRLGMVLEVATAAGGLLGGLTAQFLSERTLVLLFATVTTLVAAALFTRLERRNVLANPTIDPGRLGGRFHDEESGGTVVYRVKRLPLAFAGSFVAGNLSSLLGIGGGVLKVPILNIWCGVPMRVAAATSALMIGVTAVTAVPIYFAHGEIVPALAAAAVLGVLLGSRAGFTFSGRVRIRSLKLLLAVILLLVSAMLLLRLRS